MEKREFEVRLKEDSRSVVGLAVPFNEVTTVGSYRERFAPGAIRSIDNVKLFYQHDEPIGRVVRGEDTEEGFEVEAIISDTSRGNEVYTLLRDGVLNRFSVGFMPVESEHDEDVVVRTKVDLKEVSVVAFPAYAQAEVTQVRTEPIDNTKEIPMTDNMELTELRDGLNELERKVLTLSVPTSKSAPKFRSFGEYVSAIAHDDEEALALHREFTGGVLEDSVLKNEWVNKEIHLVDLGRPTWQAFSKATLPSSGMTIEWAELDSDTTTYAVQEAEADALTSGKVTLTTQTATVKTAGGWSEVSKQVAQRSSLPYLDTLFRAQARKYASFTNANVVTAVAAADGNTASVTDSTVAADWASMVADASAAIYGDTGLRPEFVLASVDVWKAVAVLFDSTDRPLFAANNPQNNPGNVNLVGLSGNLFGLPVVVDPSLDAGSCYVANSQAIVNYESAGAPFRLAAEDISTLTNSYAVYGYFAIATPIPDAIVKVTLDPEA